mmetsp:Transcript_12437/g.24780  ORF Transcript_12437/g.24780 Transcript_12437/m.24780 type:complete len:212 (-) Transcript_12437:364-999(-)
MIDTCTGIFRQNILVPVCSRKYKMAYGSRCCSRAWTSPLRSRRVPLRQRTADARRAERACECAASDGAGASHRRMVTIFFSRARTAVRRRSRTLYFPYRTGLRPRRFSLVFLLVASPPLFSFVRWTCDSIDNNMTGASHRRMVAIFLSMPWTGTRRRSRASYHPYRTGRRPRRHSLVFLLVAYPPLYSFVRWICDSIDDKKEFRKTFDFLG